MSDANFSSEPRLFTPLTRRVRTWRWVYRHGPWIVSSIALAAIAGAAAIVFSSLANAPASVAPAKVVSVEPPAGPSRREQLEQARAEITRLKTVIAAAKECSAQLKWCRQDKDDIWNECQLAIGEWQKRAEQLSRQ